MYAQGIGLPKVLSSTASIRGPVICYAFLRVVRRQEATYDVTRIFWLLHCSAQTFQLSLSLSLMSSSSTYASRSAVSRSCPKEETQTVGSFGVLGGTSAGPTPDQQDPRAGSSDTGPRLGIKQDQSRVHRRCDEFVQPHEILCTIVSWGPDQKHRRRQVVRLSPCFKFRVMRSSYPLKRSEQHRVESRVTRANLTYWNEGRGEATLPFWPRCHPFAFVDFRNTSPSYQAAV
jgi:hypothetical protein